MRAIWWRNERPYDTRALAEPHKMLKLDSRSISIHFKVMSKVTKGARNVQIWRRTENHWHSTAGVMWQASSALMSWNNRGKSTDTDGELLAFITLHNCSRTESYPKEFAIGRVQEISLSGGWRGQGVLLQEPSPQGIQLLCEQETIKTEPHTSDSTVFAVSVDVKPNIHF